MDLKVGDTIRLRDTGEIGEIINSNNENTVYRIKFADGETCAILSNNLDRYPNLCTTEEFFNKEIAPHVAHNPSNGPHVDNSPDMVNSPKHYTSHSSGVECIDVTENFGFCLGNAIKYIWRSDLKGNKVRDLEKAVWYIKREISKIEGDA